MMPEMTFDESKEFEQDINSCQDFAGKFHFFRQDEQDLQDLLTKLILSILLILSNDGFRKCAANIALFAVQINYININQ
jgi:hypothetical protein